jgi:hypothetical protein
MEEEVGKQEPQGPLTEALEEPHLVVMPTSQVELAAQSAQQAHSQQHQVVVQLEPTALDTPGVLLAGQILAQ